MTFDWDRKKAAANVGLDRPTFEEAVEAFQDPDAFLRFDEKHSTREVRYQLVGRARSGVLLVVFTMRGNDDITRLISVRRASRQERRDYEQKRKE